MGVTDPSEAHFKGGIWGWVTDTWVKLVATAGGALKIQFAGQDADVEVKQQAPADLTPGVYGWNGAAWTKLYTTEAGAPRVHFQGQSLDVEVKQQAPADLTPGVHGWDGSVWRKLSLVWGYTTSYMEVESSLNVAAGNHTLTFSTVGEGWVRVITNLTAHSNQANAERISLRAIRNSTAHLLQQSSLPPGFDSVTMPGSVVLKKDDYLTAYFYGCSLNDDLYAYAVGYDMKVS